MPSLAELYQQGAAMEPGAITDDQLSKMPWDELNKLRAVYRQQQDQNRLAPYEHRAYAREMTQANPIAAPVYAMMPPAYQALKVATGGQGSRTTASWDELKQGMIGTGEGLLAGINNFYNGKKR